MDFSKSVFQGFEEDTPEMLKKMMQQDFIEANLQKLFVMQMGESDRAKKAQLMKQNVENEAQLK